MTFDYDSWIKQARERLELLYDQKNAIENEIAALQIRLPPIAIANRAPAAINPTSGQFTSPLTGLIFMPASPAALDMEDEEDKSVKLVSGETPRAEAIVFAYWTGLLFPLPAGAYTSIIC